ncbi:hypothetical protein Glove_46g7 [Diversispora epigaea]|uniref:Uncharacterized protein n=1 Tax=Diversispora epigaea TaxID=1348612 RepID=A0A397JNI4_9GLOM|nr:hypothetical protein Glove_46g7 [Diversispora epigaea]
MVEKDNSFNYKEDEVKDDGKIVPSKNSGGIGRYKIIFYQKKTDQVKEKIIPPIGNRLNKKIGNLLKKYTDTIIKATSGYNIDLSKIAIVLCKNLIVSYNTYNFKTISKFF